MKTVVFKDIRPEVQEIFQHFSKQAGSERIATLVNIQALIDICREEKPTRILELGGGIGTLSYTLLKHSQASVDIYEHNDYCRGKLKENLAEFVGRYMVLDDYRVLPPNREYDLVVVDGGTGKAGDGGFNQAVWFYVQYLKYCRTFYFEGFRRMQRFWVRRALKDRFLYRLVRFEKVIFDQKEYKGGVKLICWRSHIAIFRWINFLYYEFVEWYPIKYYFQYRWQKIRALIKRVVKI